MDASQWSALAAGVQAVAAVASLFAVIRLGIKQNELVKREQERTEANERRVQRNIAKILLDKFEKFTVCLEVTRDRRDFSWLKSLDITLGLPNDIVIAHLDESIVQRIYRSLDWLKSLQSSVRTFEPNTDKVIAHAVDLAAELDAITQELAKYI